MPSWKKVIVSGSNAELSSVTGSFTGSFKGDGSLLTGVVASGSIQSASVATTSQTSSVSLRANSLAPTVTASFADSATTASFAVSASHALNVPNTASHALTTVSASIADKASTLSSTATASFADNTTTASFADISTLARAGSGSFSGSFQGDGSNLSGIATTLTVDGDSGTQDVDLQTDDLQILGTTNEIVTAVTKAGNDIRATISLPDDVTIGQDLTVTRDATITRNLTVQGTASFQHTTDLDVADRFIRLASGSNAAGDGGIAVIQSGSKNSEAFAYDAAVTRWGFTGSFDPSQNTMVPEAFVAAVIEGGSGDNDPTDTIAKYAKKGNIFVADNGEIYVYSS
tara:strand:- start:33 stop:1064 length:1032 start_codon:yes stop_codon:yes gene_type:complete